MANVIYVGNYPSDLTDEEILSIFEDFEGLVLLRSLRKRQKCYSFILCQDQEQVIDIVLSLHDIDVGGRNLIVRASDDELQDMLEECAAEEVYYEDDEQDAYSDNQCTKSVSYSSSVSQPSAKSTDNTRFRQPRNPSRLASLKEFSTNCDRDSQSRNFQTLATSSHLLNTKQSIGAQHNRGHELDVVLGHEEISYRSGAMYKDTDSVASYAPSMRSGSISPGSTSSRFSRRGKGEKFCFVSVMNFPLRTTKEELEDLFADYNPYKIVFRCNKACADKRPTEAIICFFKSKNATDAIINLDNTVYKGRVLIVIECEDIACLTELMQVQKLNAIHN